MKCKHCDKKIDLLTAFKTRHTKDNGTVIISFYCDRECFEKSIKN